MKINSVKSCSTLYFRIVQKSVAAKNKSKLDWATCTYRKSRVGKSTPRGETQTSVEPTFPIMRPFPCSIETTLLLPYHKYSTLVDQKRSSTAPDRCYDDKRSTGRETSATYPSGKYRGTCTTYKKKLHRLLTLTYAMHVLMYSVRISPMRPLSLGANSCKTKHKRNLVKEKSKA